LCVKLGNYQELYVRCLSCAFMIYIICGAEFWARWDVCFRKWGFRSCGANISWHIRGS